MELFSSDEFLAWFFTYFLDAATCPHCKAEIYEEEISESGDDYIVCPHCQEKISKEDLD